MCWWQSVALAGALSLGAPVPADHLTDCAAARPVWATTRPAAAVMDSVVSTSRRVQSVSMIAPSWWPHGKDRHPALDASAGPNHASGTEPSQAPGQTLAGAQ